MNQKGGKENCPVHQVGWSRGGGEGGGGGGEGGGVCVVKTVVV